MTITSPGITRVSTGQVGIDHILSGGLPAGRSTLVSGTSGSGKTVFALQFLATAVQSNAESAVFVTFEEPPDALRRHGESLGYDISAFEREGRWVFVDATFDPTVEEEVVGRFDLSGLITRIEHAVAKVGATRISIDSVGVAFTRFPDPPVVRRELLRLVNSLRSLGVTAVITGERDDEYGAIGRFGVEEFVCDNAMVLRNALEEETRRRTIEVLKMRGTHHLTGEFPFTILPDEGLVAITMVGTGLNAESSSERIVSGMPELDAMCGGGMFRDSVSLVSGATGTGKTLLVTEFASGGAENGERSLIFSFEESRAQLVRNARGWGKDYPTFEQAGTLRIEAAYPEIRSLEDHLVAIKNAIEEYEPTRVAIDSLSALERIAPARSFREFLISLTAFLKHRQIAALLTSTAHSLLGGESTTEAHISSLTDMIMLLRYVEIGGEVRRGFTVLKLRGSLHDKSIHEFLIDHDGMHIGAPFQNVTGILAGNPRESRMVSTRLDGIDALFEEER